MQSALGHAEGVNLSALTTPELERLLLLLVDLVDVVHGSAAAAELVARLVDDSSLTQDDPRRRILTLVLTSDASYGLPGRQAAATQAVREAEVVGPAADALLHRALLNLVVADVIAGDGLNRDLLETAPRLETRVRVDLLKESADLQRGMWLRRVEDVDTSRSALQRAIDHARDRGDDVALVTLLTHLAVTEELAGGYAAARAALADADEVASWHDWPVRSWHAEARCDLLVADGELDAARVLADRSMPDTPGAPSPSGSSATW